MMLRLAETSRTAVPSPGAPLPGAMAKIGTSNGAMAKTAMSNGATLDVAPLCADVALLSLDSEPSTTPPDWVPPYGTVRVSGPGRIRCIAAVRQPVEPARRFDLLGDVADDTDPLLGETADPVALAESLDRPSQLRLLDFLLGFCRTAFRLSADQDFAATCLRLARLCGRDGGTVAPVATLRADRVLLSGMRAPAGSALYVFGADGIRHSRVEATDLASRLQLLEPAADGDTVLAVGAEAWLWTLRRKTGPLPPVLALRESPTLSGAMARTACVRALRGAPQAGPDAALRRALQLAQPLAQRALVDPSQAVGGSLELALPDQEGGLFLRGWLRDPLRLVRDITVAAPGARIELPRDALHGVRRADVRERYQDAVHRAEDERAGFVAYINDPALSDGLQAALLLRLHSGAVIELVAPFQTMRPHVARNTVLASVPPAEVTPAMLRTCIAPATAALHRATLAERGTAAVTRLGAAVTRPSVSLCIPLFRQLGFLRAQLAAFAADPDFATVELLYVLDSPEQHAEAEHLLRGLHRLHALPLTLLTVERNLGFAAATNLAAGQARGRAIMLLNSDVVPTRSGWLRTLRDAMRQMAAAAVGPKLLFDDDSIQHAGMFFERDPDGIWFNQHYAKGLPRHWAPSLRRRRVPGLTGAALLVDRARFEAVGGVCEDYVIGDYEDSDLCLRLQQRGGKLAYVPEAELYHFERRSIELHAGYMRTLASQYNRALHHERWDGAMTAVMRQAEGWRSRESHA